MKILAVLLVAAAAGSTPVPPPSDADEPEVKLPVECTTKVCVVPTAVLQELVMEHNRQVMVIRELQARLQKARACPGDRGT